jgi:phage shock protein A
MSLMFGALYDALRQAQVPDDLARKAAEEVAGYENRLAKIESDLTLLKWMVGLVIALVSGILGKMLTA